MKNKTRVLVTGGSGFIGHHIIHYLLKKTNWEIIALDRLDLSGNLNRLWEVVKEFNESDKNRLHFLFHDLKAPINQQLSAMIGDINIILHLAAASHVDRSIEFPMEFVQDNVVGTVNILEYARTLDNLKKFVYFSTDEVFGPAPNNTQYSEYDRYNSTNPYSASKAAGEEFAVAFHNTYKLPVIITHTMNVFGVRQHPEKFIPNVIRKVRDNELVLIHADPTKTVAGSRFYINTEDVADGLFFILNMKEHQTHDMYGMGKCPKYNLVGPQEVDNLTLAEMIASVQNKSLNYEMVDFHSSRPGHDLRYALSGDLLKSLGWTPNLSLIDRIAETVHWSLQNDRWLKI